jgi:hypothetical protein
MEDHLAAPEKCSALKGHASIIKMIARVRLKKSTGEFPRENVTGGS